MSKELFPPPFVVSESSIVVGDCIVRGGFLEDDGEGSFSAGFLSIDFTSSDEVDLGPGALLAEGDEGS